jgi:hypothetical protein
VAAVCAGGPRSRNEDRLGGVGETVEALDPGGGVPQVVVRGGPLRTRLLVTWRAGSPTVGHVVNEHRNGIVAASAQWLLTAFPPAADSFAAASAQWQAREAVWVAARLRYPTDVDDALLALCGPGGCARLDWLAGADPVETVAWRTWVDEVVVSWAAALLGDPALAAAGAVAAGEPLDGPLVNPSTDDLAAAALLRHPDLLAPVADLHRAELLSALTAPPAQREECR